MTAFHRRTLPRVQSEPWMDRPPQGTRFAPRRRRGPTMSTNYYALIDECFDCGRAHSVHICKSLISFHAPVVEDWSTANPVRTIFPSSWREWKRKLFTERIEVEDEYGERFTPDEFVALVGQTVLEARRRQYDWMAAHDPIRVSAGPEIGMTWLDPDGFTFTAREFS